MILCCGVHGCFNIFFSSRRMYIKTISPGRVFFLYSSLLPISLYSNIVRTRNMAICFSKVIV